MKELEEDIKIDQDLYSKGAYASEKKSTSSSRRRRRY